MSNLINVLEKKATPKYLIYLVEGDFEIYLNIEKEPVNISKDYLNNKIFEVIDLNTINNETFYLIGVDNSELGWVLVNAPILIMESFSESVYALVDANTSKINTILKINGSLKSNELYIAKYITKYEDELFVGLENITEFVGFFSIDSIDYGNIKPQNFYFNDKVSNIYTSSNMNQSITLDTDGKEFITDKYYRNAGVGLVKIAKDYYWFKADNTTIITDEVIKLNKDYEEYYIEHLLRSLQIDKSIRSLNRNTGGGISQKYVKNLKERNTLLKEKIIRFSDMNEHLIKELKETKLELKRKKSKIDYLERLTDNQLKKLNYYEERTTKLDARVDLLQKKLQEVNTKLKKSILVKIQSKFSRK